ncbi:MAG: hypothetical protein QXN85_04015 [Candidatus Bathyarchaeia archaeon]
MGFLAHRLVHSAHRSSSPEAIIQRRQPAVSEKYISPEGAAKTIEENCDMRISSVKAKISLAFLNIDHQR